LVEIVVTVHLHTTLQRSTPTGPLRRLEVAIPAGSRLCDLLDRLSLPSLDDAILFVVNGRQADRDALLHQGDDVHLIPPLSGG
jgi:molybdopterin converting factor small subunit